MPPGKPPHPPYAEGGGWSHGAKSVAGETTFAERKHPLHLQEKGCGAQTVRKERRKKAVN